MQNQPVFEFLPFETLISENQKSYYNALAASDKAGKATPFITYMPGVINDSLSQLLNYNNRTLTDLDCLEHFISLEITESITTFTRKDYRNVFKDIATATASRDLKNGTALQLFEKTGLHNKTAYKITD